MFKSTTPRTLHQRITIYAHTLVLNRLHRSRLDLLDLRCGMKLVFAAMHELRFDGPNPLTMTSTQYTVMPSQGVVVGAHYQ